MDKNYCKPLSVSTAPNALTERIKELNCLYGISNLFENQDVSLSWIMQRAVELIPAAWQYPENACARIGLDGQEYISREFQTDSMAAEHENYTERQPCRRCRCLLYTSTSGE